MKRTGWIALGFAAALACGAVWTATLATPAVAAEDPIWGAQLMTEQERNTYRQELMNAKTEEERNQIRAQHHETIMTRAKEKGVTLPEDTSMGKGMSPGMGKDMGGMGDGGMQHGAPMGSH